MGMNAIEEALVNRERKSIPSEDILKILAFVLRSNYFELDRKVKQQLSGTAIGTKCSPPYACIFMDKVEPGFLESQKHKPVAWFYYINDNFWTHAEKELEHFRKELNKTHQNLKFTNDSSQVKISFLDLSVNLSNGKLYVGLHINAADCHRYL